MYSNLDTDHCKLRLNTELNRIYKTLLGLVENQKPHKKETKSDTNSINQSPNRNRTCSQQHITGSFNNVGQRIIVYQPSIIRHLALNQGHRIHHRRKVHQQLHAKTNEVTQIPVFGHQGGNQHPESQPQNPHQGNQQGKKQERHIQAEVSPLKIVNNIKSHKNQELDTEFQQIGNHGGNRHDQTRKIHLAKYGGIAPKGVRSTGEAGSEIIPDHDARQVEQERRHGTGSDAGHFIENNGEGNRGKQRLDQVPQGPQDGLLINGYHVPFHEQQQQIAVLPHLLEVQRKEFVFWRYFKQPFVIEIFGILHGYN